MKRIILIGETCTDKWVYTQHTRQSPENSKVPVLKVVKEHSRPGMAAFVSKVMNDIGLEHDLITVPTTIDKIRIFKGDTQLFRLDYDTLTVSDTYIHWMKPALTKADVIVVSDYGKGLLTDDVTNLFSGKKVYLDPHPDNDITKYNNVFCVKLNEKELYHFTRETDLYAGSRKLIDLCNIEHLFVTMGKDGMFYMNKDKTTTSHVESQVVYPKNVAGAGDVVLAVLVKEIEAGNSIKQCMKKAMETVRHYVEV